MSSKDIKAKLNKMGYPESVISILSNGQLKLIITGECHVQEIKDAFKVVKWEYSGNTVEFVLGE